MSFMAHNDSVTTVGVEDKQYLCPKNFVMEYNEMCHS